MTLRTSALFTVIMLVVGLTAGCGDDNPIDTPTITTGKVEGRITDLTTGQPVEGVTITTSPSTQSVVTGPDGTFMLPAIIAGQYSITAGKTGYRAKSIEVQVVAGSTIRADMILTALVALPTTTNALQFNGTNNMVVVPDAPALDLSGQSFTIECYIYSNEFRLSGGDIWNCVIGHGTSNDDLDYLLGFKQGRPMFYVRNNAAGMESSIALVKNRWYHIAAVQDAEQNSLMIYVDGIVVATATLKGPLLATAGSLFIGARESYGTGKGAHFFEGLIHEVRIWNVARTIDQINETMKTSLIGDEVGLVGYWPLNEGLGTAVVDKSTSNNNGLIMGSPMWLSIPNPLAE